MKCMIIASPFIIGLIMMVLVAIFGSKNDKKKKSLYNESADEIIEGLTFDHGVDLDIED